MNRRQLIIAVTTLALLASTGGALARDKSDDVVEWLEDEGYTVLEFSRTLLGRARVVASLNGVRRELIINPRTGEILRDVWIDAGGEIRTLGERRDDDDDDDDHSGHGGGGDDDDNSGHGSSGSGGGDDKSGHGGGDD